MENGEFNYRECVECSGAIICARDTNRVMLLQKRDGRNAGRWGLVGGKTQSDESAWQGLLREIEEEIGIIPEIKKTLPLEKFVSNDSLFKFHTYFCVVEKEFIPKLSNEHTAWGWFSLVRLPKPIHKGLDLSIHNKIIQTKIQTIIDVIADL